MNFRRRDACSFLLTLIAAITRTISCEIPKSTIVEASASIPAVEMFHKDHSLRERERYGYTGRISTNGSGGHSTVLKLSRPSKMGGARQQQLPSTARTILRSLLERYGRMDTSSNSSSGCPKQRHRCANFVGKHTRNILKHGRPARVAPDHHNTRVELHRVVRALKGALRYGGVRGLTVVVLLLVSVAATNTTSLSSHFFSLAKVSCSGPSGGGADSNRTPPTGVECSAEVGVENNVVRSRPLSLSTVRRGMMRWRHSRPALKKFVQRFPLAHASWWKPQQDRKKRLSALGVAEGLAAEKHEVTKRTEGTQIFRAAQFWGRSATIYLSYKMMQARCALELPRIADAEERELRRKAWWDDIHELNSDRMLKLCLDLRGFYLKSGQFLGTRHDFMPKIFLKKLGKLHDDVPPMPARRVWRVLLRELNTPPEELFSSLNLTHPVGSASISQVHEGVLRETGEKVAVKVQYPGAERVMMSDLRNLKALAWFLQKFELNFDILSSLKELSRQIKGEFDFRVEARTLDRMHLSLGGHSRRINLPESRLSTKRVLVMSYLEGESLAQLKRGAQERFVAARKRIGKNLLHELADAWGFMIFHEGLFNADPHPGNVLIMPEERVGPIKRGFSFLGLRTPKLRVGLLDWGQIKELSRSDREKVASLILAVSARHSEDIVTCFKSLGVKLSNPDDDDSIEKLALVMFDTRNIKGLDFNPFSNNNVLKLNAVKEYPQDLYFILRTVLMFRGMAQSLGVEFSLADIWTAHANRMTSSPCLKPP